VIYTKNEYTEKKLKSFFSRPYLGALTAAIKMGDVLKDDVTQYRDLLTKGIQFFETELYDGEYFYQKITTKGLNAEFKPLDASSNGKGYSDIVEMLNTEGPKYQYGTGCLSDGILGFWMARVCGLDEIINVEKIKSNLNAIHKYNLKYDLTDHSNPQRPAFAVGKDGRPSALYVAQGGCAFHPICL